MSITYSKVYTRGIYAREHARVNMTEELEAVGLGRVFIVSNLTATKLMQADLIFRVSFTGEHEEVFLVASGGAQHFTGRPIALQQNCQL